MATSLEVILSDDDVRSVLVNIFGGITRCDLVAEGILEALKRVEARVPIVVRLDGTNAEEGRKILAEAGHERIVPEETMLSAARRAVELAAERT
jgi:succinyl-CoA synthetase beta subunit